MKLLLCNGYFPAILHVANETRKNAIYTSQDIEMNGGVNAGKEMMETPDKI